MFQYLALPIVLVVAGQALRLVFGLLTVLCNSLGCECRVVTLMALLVFSVGILVLFPVMHLVILVLTRFILATEFEIWLQVGQATTKGVGGYVVPFPSSARGFFSRVAPEEEIRLGLGWTRRAVTQMSGVWVPKGRLARRHFHRTSESGLSVGCSCAQVRPRTHEKPFTGCQVRLFLAQPCERFAHGGPCGLLLGS